MVLEETINKLLRDIVNLILVSSEYAIKAKQNAPRPSGAYAAIDFVNDTGMGWEQRIYTDNQLDLDITETIQGAREIMMSIGFYRDDSIDNARKVRTAVIRESIQELLSAAGLGLVGRSEVRQIDEQFENGWEKRAQFDIVLSAVGEDSDVIRSIQSVDIAGEFQARGLSYNLNIEVP